MTAVFTVSSSFRMRANLSFPEVEQLTSFHKWEIGRIGTGKVMRIKYDQCWHNIMSCKPA